MGNAFFFITCDSTLDAIHANSKKKALPFGNAFFFFIC